MKAMLPASVLLAAILSCASNDPARTAGHSDESTSGTAQVEEQESTNPSPQMTTSYRDTTAYATLLKADYFESPWVGRQMEPSRNALAFEELMRLPDAADAMAELFNAEHAPQVRLYGLCGIYFTDHANFADSCNDLARMRVTVGYLRGDVLISAQPLSTLIRAEDGDPPLTFPVPERAVSQWRSKVADASAGYSLDIAHGGLPTGLRVAGSGGAP